MDEGRRREAWVDVRETRVDCRKTCGDLIMWAIGMNCEWCQETLSVGLQ